MGDIKGLIDLAPEDLDQEEVSALLSLCRTIYTHRHVYSNGDDE